MFQIIALLLFCTSTFPIFASNESMPLFLTPFIEESRTEEARNLSIVDSDSFHVKSFSGYLTVNATFNSNLFFWYFPVAGRDLDKTPWIIWLQGGPGATSLFGLFKEIGPFSYDNGIKKRETSWCRNYSMIFIDNPVGAGFSFTDQDDGYPEAIETYSKHLYTAVQQLISVYPELRSAPLYIAGESYAGRYVPGLALEILEGRQRKDIHINLQGLIMGNPTLDRDSITDFTRVFYNWGLVDAQGARAAKPLQEEFDQSVRNGDPIAAYEARNDLLDKLQYTADIRQTYNALKQYEDLMNFVGYVDSAKFRRLVHVGDKKFDPFNTAVRSHMKRDSLASITPRMEKTLEYCRVLIYCGQLDLTSPCVLNAEARRRKWHWSGREKFLAAARLPWWFNDTLTGYIKSGGGFTEVSITGAGHLVPIDKPAELQQLVKDFIEDVQVRVPDEFSETDLPVYEEYNPPNTGGGLGVGLIASFALNVVLLVAVVVSVIFLMRFKKREVGIV